VRVRPYGNRQRDTKSQGWERAVTGTEDWEKVYESKRTGCSGNQKNHPDKKGTKKAASRCNWGTP